MQRLVQKNLGVPRKCALWMISSSFNFRAGCDAVAPQAQCSYQCAYQCACLPVGRGAVAPHARLDAQCSMLLSSCRPWRSCPASPFRFSIIICRMYLRVTSAQHGKIPDIEENNCARQMYMEETQACKRECVAIDP